MSVSDTIIQIDDNKENPLRQEARLVKPNEFNTPYLLDVLTAMKKALLRESDGVAIAAPQIGITLQIFVVSASAYPPEAKWKPLIFINPKITKASKKLEEMHEGCLSVRWLYGKTARSKSVTIEAYNEQGVKFSYGASGLIAQIFQHETDHLQGTLFIDHGYDIEEFTEEEVKASLEKK